MATKSEIAATAQPENAPVTLTKKEIERYSRHLIMPEVGMDGQLKLKQAKVLCIGTGGLGAPLGLISRGGGRRANRLSRFRPGRRQQLAASGFVQH